MKAEEWLREQAETVDLVSGPPDGKDRILSRVRSRSSKRRVLQILAASLEAGVVVLAVIVVVAAIGRANPLPAAFASATAMPSREPAAIQWIDLPGAKFHPAPVSAAPCVPADLTFEPTRQGAYHGLATQQIVVTNTSASACKMVGAPVMSARAKALSKSVDRDNFTNESLVIESGTEAMMLVGAPARCTPKDAEIADTLAISIGSATAIQVRGIYLPLTCGSPVLVLFEDEAAAPSADPLSSLVASWMGPGSTAPGSTVSYVVRLANPTGQNIELAPCPSYTQHANGDDVSETLLLNCADAPIIPAGGFKDFGMQLTLPSDLTSAEIKVGWHLEVANGTTTGSVITLR